MCMDHALAARIKALHVAAAKRALVVGLAPLQLRALMTSPCAYCGVAPDPTNGVDRIDSAGHYVASNTCACCSFCNMGKRAGTAEEFVAKCERVCRHNEVALLDDSVQG